jgi:hypothetical protein
LTDDSKCRTFGAKEATFMSEENKKPETKIEAGELSPNELDNVTGGSVASVVQSVVNFLLPVQEGAELTEDPNNNYGKDRSRPVSFPD